MIFSDETIRELIESDHIRIEPEPKDWQFQPASLELTLGEEFTEPYQNTKVINKQSYTLLPGECVLATTVERIMLRPWIAARVEGKSSWGRRFLLTHVTAGFIDPGFEGTVTLELVNLSRVSQTLTVGEPIVQLSFHGLDQAAHRPYGHPELNSHYQGQQGATPSALPWC